MTAGRKPMLELAIDVPLWLQQDADLAYADRVARDRGVPCGGEKAGDPVARIRRWWAVRNPEADLPGHTVVRIRRLLTAGLIAIGGLGGSGAALALFHYDGREPVNLAQVIGVFVVLQIVLAALSILLLPSRIPVISALQDALAELSPGAIAAALARRWLPRPAADVAPLGWHGARRPAVARLARWQAFLFSQALGLAFNVSALICALALITFTDLAFAWSTTLAVDAETITEIARLLALPFAAVAPTAVPDLGLVESTRFARIEGITALPVTSGYWWPFVALTMLFWGVLPRVGLLALAAWRLRIATRDLLLEDPRVTALLDRMDTPAVRQSADIEGLPPSAGQPDAGAAEEPPPGGRATGIIWSAACDAAAARSWLEGLGLQATTIHAAGGNATVEQDRAVIASIASEPASRIALLCRGFEPPILELLDFIETLAAAQPTASIVLVLIGDHERRVGRQELGVWRSATARLGLTKLYVEAAA